MDTGGSSSGSGSAMAANYATAAVGTETSGSILSPSSSNSVVGLKPTTGLLSRIGIVPLSGTFDTPGPMTRSVTDNTILFSAMYGTDAQDPASANNPATNNFSPGLKPGGISGKRFGAIKAFLKDTLYQKAVEQIKALGGYVVEYEPAQADNDGFGQILNADMKKDLPEYLASYAGEQVKLRSVKDIIDSNLLDTTNRIPYGQGRFIAVEQEKLTGTELANLIMKVRANGVNYFEKPMQEHTLDAVLSINNFSAGFAAAANYPCITVPMGYRQNGTPAGITFIARPFREELLLQLAYDFETATHLRQPPRNYR